LRFLPGHRIKKGDIIMKSASPVARVTCGILILSVLGCGALLPDTAGRRTRGPLQAGASNPRYFADRDGKAVYLTGSHTWNNLKDMGASNPPEPFDYDAYLDFLATHRHNFMRLWTWELSRFSYDNTVTHAGPFPWLRTGPGIALDGMPRFDLTRFDPAYFKRLRDRVQAAGTRGIYVSIMLFEGHGLHASQTPWRWEGHPFHAGNNVNGIDGDPNGDGRGLETHMLEDRRITGLQEAYVREVIDAVNDLDNVLFEIANESGAYSTEWQYHLIRYIQNYEREKPKQHPVGMTFQYTREEKSRGKNATLFQSPADWISPNPDGGYRDNPPPAEGNKIILLDTDHLWGIGGDRSWVWKSFCRGHNPIFMDPYREAEKDAAGKVRSDWTGRLTVRTALDPRWDSVRKNMGYTRDYAVRLNLGATVPHSELASTGFCLAAPGAEYLVFQPEAGKPFTIQLVPGNYRLEWFNPETGIVAHRGEFTAAAVPGSFTPPFPGDAVLYLWRSGRQR
jgi:hypothetical protein